MRISIGCFNLFAIESGLVIFINIITIRFTCNNEICDDIKFQIENGIADCPLFNMTLVPEGNPPVDKAAAFCKKYRLFQEKLHSIGLKCGILVQATIGHGGPLAADFPYEHLINLTDGKKQSIVCPYDEGFREYIKNVMTTLAHENPDVIMVASGSEVSTLVAGAELLAKDGIKTRIVSAPSEGLFRNQSKEYRESILPTGAKIFGLTAGLPVNLQGLVGANGKIWGLESFGFSAPYKVLDEKLGFNAENVYNQVKSML